MRHCTTLWLAQATIALAPNTPTPKRTQKQAATLDPPLTRIAPPSAALRRLPGGGTSPTVWSEFADLAREVDHKFEGGVANLGQGFPNWAPPQFVKDGLRRAASEESAGGHQYARSAGHPPEPPEPVERLPWEVPAADSTWQGLSGFGQASAPIAIENTGSTTMSSYCGSLKVRDTLTK